MKTIIREATSKYAMFCVQRAVTQVALEDGDSNPGR